MTADKKTSAKKALEVLDFEHKNKPLLPLDKFYRRQLHFVLYSSLLIFISLAIGTFGYSLFAKFDLVKSFHNASMILAGMGEIDPMPDNRARIFSGVYALFSGVVFLSTVAVMFSPLVHRMLHLMHIEKE